MIFFIAQLLLGAAIATPCQTVPNPSPRANHICNVTGYVKPFKNGDTPYYRRFPGSNLAYCLDQCQSDFECAAAGYNATSKQCLFRYPALLTGTNSAFVADETTNTIFADYDCAIRSGFCGPTNPSFEANHSPGFPANVPGNFWAAAYEPWTSSPEPGHTKKAYAVVTKNSATKFPTPYGSKFLEVHTSKNLTTFVQATMTVDANTSYTGSYSYSFQAYNGTTVPKGTSIYYLLRLSIDTNVESQQLLDEVELFPAKGAVNGKWNTRTTPVYISPPTAGEAEYSIINFDVTAFAKVGSTTSQPAANYVVSAVFGIDNFVITPA